MICHSSQTKKKLIFNFYTNIMKKKRNKPTAAQYSYIASGLLAAKIQRNGVITQEDVKEAVETAEMAYDLIYEIMGDTEDDDDDDSEPKKHKEKEPLPNYFRDYEWEDGKATWSELNAWLKSQGITSNRRISCIFRDSIEKGYIRRDEKARLYLPPLP